MAVAALALLAVAAPAQAQFRSSPPPPPAMRPPPPPPVRVAPPPSSSRPASPNKVGPSAGADKGALRGTGQKPGVPVKPATPAKPSTGPRAQPVPLRRLVPPPPRVVPTGAGANTGSFLSRSPQTARTVLGQGDRDWRTDGRVIERNPRLGDPYYHGRGATDGVTNVYYGDTSSSAFYLFAGAMLFNPPQDRPLPPQATDEVGQGIASLLGVIESERKIMAERAKAKAKTP
jgi:hypothetical protein